MSTRGGRSTTKKSRKSPAKSAGKTSTGAREFTRKAKAAELRATRRQTMRRRAATRSQATLSLIAVSRNALARIPRAALVCALVAFLNALAWAQITPAFQGSDEADHYAYVQELVEADQLPSSSVQEYSPAETQVLQDLHYVRVRFRPDGRLISSTAEQNRMESDLAQPPARRGSGAAGVAASEPPLYYALEAIPYSFGASGSVLDRLELMRLLSAMMAGLTALFVFLFLREALPSARWAWTVGGLGVALAPVLGLVSGAVNPDALLFAVSAALFYCLARAFRRGFTRRAGIVIGAVIATGLLTKLNFIGLVPGALLGLFLLARREARTSGPQVYYRSLAPSLLIALSPGVLYALVNALSSRPVLGIASSGLSGLVSGGHSISSGLSYIWQLYLPRLPGMHKDFGEIFTTRQIWFRNVVGMYGWSDTVFPKWVYNVALIPAVVVLALCLRELTVSRIELRGRAAEILTYALMSLGVLVLVGAADYLGTAAEFAEARYLFPMLALWGAVLALTARGAGRRWGPAVGALIVVLAMAHDIFSQLQDIARYYS
jgi:Predicted membrane protein (DUF2142)